MKKSYYSPAIVLIMSAMISWAQSEIPEKGIKSIETKLYKAVSVNGEQSKEAPVYKVKAGFPLTEDFDLGKIDYDETGLITDIYYPNNKGDYYLKDHYVYNENRNVIRAVLTMFELNDSIVLNMTYDAMGHLEKTRWNKRLVPVKGFFNKMFHRYWGSELIDEDYHRYYLSGDVDVDRETEIEFEGIHLLSNHHFKLLDENDNLLKEKYLYVDTTQAGPLEPKVIDSITVEWEYGYTLNNLLREERKIVEKKSLQKGLAPMKFYDKKITTLEYKYDEQDRPIEAIRTVEQLPSKTGFLKIKGKTSIYRKVYEYSENGKKRVIYFYDDKDKLELTKTHIFDELGRLIESTEEGNKRKLFETFNEESNHLSYILFKKGKKIAEYTSKYTYNEQGDWIECVYFDNLNNEPLYAVERTIEYFGAQ